jgi:uncharacterized membrane protein
MIRRIRPSMSDRRFVVLALMAGLTALVMALVAFRVLYTHSLFHTALIWNLVLAWIPFLLALLVYDRAERRRSVLLPAALWLLFFPNAPYIVTDFVHLDQSQGLAYWFDLVLIATVAATGLLLGFASLYLVQAVVGRLVGPRLGWGFVVAALALSSFGVYLGRVWRWNSWDPIVRPQSVLDDLASAASNPHPRPFAFMLVFTAFLAATYGAFYLLARTGLPRERLDGHS